MIAVNVSIEAGSDARPQPIIVDTRVALHTQPADPLHEPHPWGEVALEDSNSTLQGEQAGSGSGEDSIELDLDAVSRNATPMPFPAVDLDPREAAVRQASADVFARVRCFYADHEKSRKDDQYVLYRPESGSWSCSAAHLEALAARGGVLESDLVRRVATGSSYGAFEIPWLRKAIVDGQRIRADRCAERMQASKVSRWSKFAQRGHLMLLTGMGMGVALAHSGLI